MYGGDGLGAPGWARGVRALRAAGRADSARGRSRRSPGWCGRACWRCWRPRRSAWRRRARISGAAAAATISTRRTNTSWLPSGRFWWKQLRRLGKIEPPAEIAVVAAEPLGYRNRVQLHVEEKRLGYREARSHKLCAVERVSDRVAEDQRGDRGAARDAARRALAAIRAVARSVHRRARGADQRAGDGPAGGAAFLRLVRDADSGAGGGRAGLPGRVPREQQFVLPGEPVPDRPAGGGGDRKARRARRRSICTRAWGCSRCRWRGASAR